MLQTHYSDLSLSLCLSHRYVADQWACCLCQAAVHHSCWIIHVLWRRGAEWDRPYKAKLIKVAVLKVCLCLFQEERKERSAVIPFLSPCLYPCLNSSPHLPPSLASLIPFFPWLSQENYNLTAHFNISASKWVWQALLCVSPPTPHPPPCVPTSIHTPTPLSLSQPPRVVCLSFPRRFKFYHVTGEREGDGKKQKQISLNPRPLCQAIRLSLSASLWVSWHVHDHEPTMRKGIASPWCMPLIVRLRCTQAMFQSDRAGSDLNHRDRHVLRIEVCVCHCAHWVY